MQAQFSSRWCPDGAGCWTRPHAPLPRPIGIARVGSTARAAWPAVYAAGAASFSIRKSRSAPSCRRRTSQVGHFRPARLPIPPTRRERKKGEGSRKSDYHERKDSSEDRSLVQCEIIGALGDPGDVAQRFCDGAHRLRASAGETRRLPPTWCVRSAVCRVGTVAGRCAAVSPKRRG